MMRREHRGEQILAPEWLWIDGAPTTGRCVVLRHDKIVEVARAERYPEAERMPGMLLLPGMVNAHSHAFQRAFRGQVQWSARADDDFWTWRDRMYQAANGLDAEGIEAVSALAFLEMVEAGYTTVGEFHYLHRQPDGTAYDDPDELAWRVIAAARSVGLRIVLLRVVYAAGGFGQPLRPDQQRFRTDSPDEALAAVERLRRSDDPLLGVGLAPHSVRAVPAAWLPAFAGQGPLHVHVSEQPAEVEACVQATGRTPLALLDDAGLVGPTFTAVHLTHPTADEVERVRRAGASVAACPTTELDLGDGFLPLALREGVSLCIGSDSQARIDPWAELRALELHGRGLAQRRLVMGVPGQRHGLCARLLGIGAAGGARSLGLTAVGTIAAGQQADLIAVDLDRPEALGVPQAEALVFSGGPSWIRRVWIGGREVLRDGRHPRRDAIVARAAPYLRR